LNHDSGHRLVDKETDTCYNYQWFWSNVVFGANSLWWREEHDVHHSATNTYDFDHETGFYDPQACEDVFCQADVLVGFFKAFHHPFFLTYQHYIIIPLVTMFSRPGLMIDGYINKKEKDPKQWLGLALHLTWCWLMFRMLDCPWYAAFVGTNV